MASSATGAAAKRTACGKHQPNLRSSQVEFSTTVRLRAASVLALLCIHASEGLLHYSPSLQACSRHNLGGEVSSSRRSSPFGRKRCRNRRDGLILPPSKCFNSDVDWRSRKHDVADDAAVHTLLIDNYDSYTYNLFQLLAVVNGRPPFVVYNDDDDGDLWKAIARMGRTPDNIVISPGPGRPDVPADFGMCAQALREATDVPILGVCLGHEGLGLAHGAAVTRAREPFHGRLSQIFHDGDALFRGVPQEASVVRYHSLVVDTATLPAAGPLEGTAWTEDGVLMAMKHKEYPHWGVQFHPESVGTQHGREIISNFRDLTIDWSRRRQGDGDSDDLSLRRVGRLGAWDGRIRRGDRRVTMETDTRGTSNDRPIPASPAVSTLEVSATQGLESEVTAPSPHAHPSSPSGSKRQAFVLHVEEISIMGRQENNDLEESDSRSRAAARRSMIDTEHAFRTLYGDEPTAWWLDSSSQRPGLDVDGQAKARFSFMGAADGPLAQIIECYGGDRLFVQKRSESGELNGHERREIRANIFDFVKAEMAKMGHAGGPSAVQDAMEIRMAGGLRDESSVNGARTGTSDDNVSDGVRHTLPFEFLGGFVGFLGYELRHEAKDVLERSAGGTEWEWQPPNGCGRWDGVTFERQLLSDPGSSTSEASLNGQRKGTTKAGFEDQGEDVPLGFLVFADRFVAFDHQEGKAYVLALAQEEDDAHDEDAGSRRGAKAEDVSSSSFEMDAQKWIRSTAETLRGIAPQGLSDGALLDGRDFPSPLMSANTTVFGSPTPTAAADVTSRDEASTSCVMDVPRSRYEQSLNEIMRLVGEGETYEVCLTNQIVCERPGGNRTSPLELYARLRRSNPAPYAAYIVHDPRRRLSRRAGREALPDEARRGSAFAVCCSSPEKFLKVDRDGWAESKPIKGTVKRGKTPAEDLALATELAKGEKNMAENLMIVDLVRNDLGRVCRTGSVSVPKLMQVESYATVHQLVSTIRGKLSSGCGALDAIAAAFPGGSMTGAPKQRTMDIIDRLEQGRPRGVYSGSIGFLGIDGAADFNIVIRTAVVTPQNITVGAGGAVIAMSQIDDEYEEMLLKATSVLGAIGHKPAHGRSGPAGSEPLAMHEQNRSLEPDLGLVQGGDRRLRRKDDGGRSSPPRRRVYAAEQPRVDVAGQRNVLMRAPESGIEVSGGAGGTDG